ncbi:MAG: response regulator transcription factor [Candidatus Binatia bacterium]
MRLAYVEDDADARTIFAAKLTAEGFKCNVFSTAESLLGIATPGAYDALIIDIRLPGRNGVDLLRELRHKGIFTPAIIITAFNSLDYAREALNSGANYLLEKPFSFASLIHVLRKVLDSPQSLQDCVDRGLAMLQPTEREEEVARLMLKGLRNAEIARITRLSEKTVKQYVTQIFQKAGVDSRGEFFSFIFPT